LHPELVAISNLWQADVRVDSLRAEHERLVATVNSTIQAQKDAIAARDAARAALDATKTEERHNSRELDSYAQKRDATKKMLDDGSAPNYEMAERQLANCIALVDELETKGLDLLDRLDARTAELAAAEKARVDAESAEKAARQALGARDAALRVELTEALRLREVVWKELPFDYQTPYSEIRRRKRVALVNVVEGNCVVCHMRVAPQKLNEVMLKRAVHTCVGCGGYLLPGPG
jgi:predicted  nucleic acid-binding Zn-ribbon protein